MAIDKPPQIELPDKLYFKVGEVSDIVGVPAYVLRFWEKEFPRIKPKRTPAGQRLYRKADVELILNIKQLRYKEKFTIEGTRKHLRSSDRNAAAKPDIVDEIRAGLREIRDLLDRKA